METPFGDLLAWVLQRPVSQGGDAGCEKDWWLLGRLGGEIDEVSNSCNMRLERFKAEIKVYLPLIVFGYLDQPRFYECLIEKYTYE